jgi:8-oxo-dGTP pyrophosphatase MutT (NUDIX family)
MDDSILRNVAISSWQSNASAHATFKQEIIPQPMSIFHPKVDDHGKPVLLINPSMATPLYAWQQADAVATVLPEGVMPEGLNGVPLQEWINAPENPDAWNNVAGQLEIEEPPFLVPQGKKPAAGVVVQEPDGRIWLVSPSNQFGGYKATFPKGRIEGKVNPQASAIREAYEEAGLKVQITGFLGDSVRSQTYTRYYLAQRTGGNPALMCWESQAVHLVPAALLSKFLIHTSDLPLLKAVLALSVNKPDPAMRKIGNYKSTF